MTSTYVACCSICGIAPFSENDSKGLGYTLRRFPDDQLYCADHYPPKARVARASSPPPAEALAEIEQQIATANGRIEALDLDDDASGKLIVAIWRDFRRDVERNVAALRKSLSPANETKPRRKPSPHVNRKRQVDLLEASPAATTSDESEDAP